MLLVPLLIAAPVLMLVALTTWAVWHLTHDEQTYPGPAKTRQKVALESLAHLVEVSESLPQKETPKHHAKLAWFVN